MRLTARYWVSYLLRFATIRHYPSLFALFLLFAIRDYSLFAIRDFSLFGFSRHPFANDVSGFEKGNGETLEVKKNSLSSMGFEPTTCELNHLRFTSCGPSRANAQKENALADFKHAKLLSCYLPSLLHQHNVNCTRHQLISAL